LVRTRRYQSHLLDLLDQRLEVGQLLDIVAQDDGDFRFGGPQQGTFPGAVAGGQGLPQRGIDLGGRPVGGEFGQSTGRHVGLGFPGRRSEWEPRRKYSKQTTNRK